MAFSRRRLLAGAGLVGLAWVSQPSFALAALAAGRRVALLIGIDRYSPELQGCEPLRGCLQDLELQRRLLQYRFGFAPEDIWVLADEAATEAGVLAALTRLAAAADLVVVQFSGYGGWRPSGPPVRDAGIDSEINSGVDSSASNSSSNDSAQDSAQDSGADRVLVLYDSKPDDGFALADLHAKLQGLDSEVWLLIDAAFESGSSEPGITRRVRPGLALKPLPTTLLRQKSGRSAPFTPIAAEFAGQEQQIGGLSSGQLTAAWTEELWQLDGRDRPSSALAQFPRRTKLRCDRAGAIGALLPRPLAPSKTPVPVEAPPVDAPPADASIRNALPIAAPAPETATVWIGGLPLGLLAAYGPGAILLADTTPLTVLSRSGLLLSVQGNGPLPFDPIVTEGSRLIPRDLPLTIGLDRSLDRLERVDATSAIAPIPLTLVAEEGADLWLSLGPPQPRPPDLDAEANDRDNPQFDRTYRLSSPSLVTPTQVFSGAIKSVIQGLIPQLDALRAQKRLNLLGPSALGSSALGSSALGPRGLGPAAPIDLGLQPLDAAGRPNPPRSGLFKLSGPQQFWFENSSDRPYYALLLAWQPTGFLALHVPEGGAALELPPGSRTESEPWQPKLTGRGQIYVLVSPRPWSQTLASLRRQELAPKDSFWQPLRQPGPIVTALVTDIQGRDELGSGLLPIDRWSCWIWPYCA
jgi:hypothetical protein